MADVTEPRRVGTDTDGVTPSTDSASAPTPAAPDDAAAVRVRLAALGATGADPTVVIRPATTRVAGGDPAVLAQRHATVDGHDALASMATLGSSAYRLLADGAATDVVVEEPHAIARGVTSVEVLVDGFRFEVEVEAERLASLRERAMRDRSKTASTGRLEIRAVIPGRLVALWVAEGDTVLVGDRLLAIEAMKMQNELLAPRGGTIARIGAPVGATVEIGDVLVVIE